LAILGIYDQTNPILGRISAEILPKNDDHDQTNLILGRISAEISAEILPKNGLFW